MTFQAAVLVLMTSWWFLRGEEDLTVWYGSMTVFFVLLTHCHCRRVHGGDQARGVTAVDKR